MNDKPGWEAQYQIDALRADLAKAQAEAAAMRAALTTVERSGAPGGSIFAKRSDEHACCWCRGMYSPCPVPTAKAALASDAGRALLEEVEALRKRPSPEVAAKVKALLKRIELDDDPHGPSDYALACEALALLEGK